MRNLLIVDDERTIREGISKCLKWESLGIGSVFTACDGKQAYDIINQNKIDIVIADIIMPELTGIELVEKCKEANLPVKFIFLSSYDDFKFTQKAIKNEVCDYLLKPCNTHELKNIVSNLVTKLDSIDNNKKNLSIMQKKIETILPHAKEQIMHELLEAAPNNKERINELCTLLQLKPGTYSLLLMPLMANTNNLPSLKQLINDLMDKFEDCISCYENNKLIVLYKNNLQNTVSEVTKYISELLQKTEFSNTPIIISEVSDFQHISQNYLKVIEISRLLHYFDKSSIIYADFVNLREYDEDKKDAENIKNFFHLLVDSIQNNKTTEALSLLNEIFKLFKINLYNFKSIQRISLRIYLSIIDSTKENNQHYAEKLTLITEAFNIENIYEVLVQEISHVVVLNEENLYNTYSKAVRTTIDYINKNYMNYDLSLNQIASSVLFMNTDYLGKLFKKECGIKFSDYLLSLRMKKAKQMLSSSDVPISYVAEKVGFGSNNTYFSQLFKKYIGVLPKDYKYSLQKK